MIGAKDAIGRDDSFGGGTLVYERGEVAVVGFEVLEERLDGSISCFVVCKIWSLLMLVSYTGRWPDFYASFSAAGDYACDTSHCDHSIIVRRQRKN